MFKSLDRWLLPYIFRRRPPRVRGPIHLVLSVCDHFEPFHATDKAGAMERVKLWREKFPQLSNSFVDSDGITPKHTFFYPIEQYDADVLDGIADLCPAGGTEPEIHLHHENDSAARLKETLEKGKRDLSRHGLLSRSRDGEIRFGFIHGNWALDNSHPEGLHCGVSGELGVLRESGCYADFTLPSAPSPCQTKTVDSLYYARSSSEPKSHDKGLPASSRTASLRDSPEHLLMIQGPLGLNWRWRKAGILPRIENGDVTGANPPTPLRLSLWLDLGIHVRGHPEVVFVKLHTHGALPRNSDALLGDPMRRFHQHLASRSESNPDFHFHYTTAREMANIVHALEEIPAGQIPDFAKIRSHCMVAGQPSTSGET